MNSSCRRKARLLVSFDDASDALIVQELMEPGGWKSYEMVLRYAHLAPEHLANAAAHIEKPLETVAKHSTISLR